jgi:hypothetical protein
VWADTFLVKNIEDRRQLQTLNFLEFLRLSSKKEKKIEKVPKNRNKEAATYDAFGSGLGCAERCTKLLLLLL